MFPIFFTCYADPRDPHSFPTRRSSDLRPRYRKVNPSDAPILIITLRSQTVPTSEIYEIANRSEGTRLNSSHSQISYAVFCLKKKNKSKNHHASHGTLI